MPERGHAHNSVHRKVTPMYGTVARMTLKQGMEEEFRKYTAEMSEGADLRGWISSTLYRSDSNPLEVWLAVVFESREAYQKNAASPEQHGRYEKMRSMLDADPEWHDGDVISKLGR
jgi:heme-degrading monooxygenase HmoA